MDLGISGRSAVVCASSAGLGFGCALALAEAGAVLFVNGRNHARLKEAAQTIADRTGAEVHAVAADIATAIGQDQLLSACPEPDILVTNCDGPPFRDHREIGWADLEEGTRMNMIAPLNLVLRALPGMTARGFGRVVNITSVSVKMPMAGLDLSSGARAGLTAFLAGVSRQVAADGVTINNLLPGMFDTQRLTQGFEAGAKRSGLSVSEFSKESRLAIPAKRFGQPEEFGRVCAFLCSIHGGYITGQSLLCDGGLFPGAF